MKLAYEQYRDKVMGCWAGKNIGGVLGEPYEGVRRKIEIDFYTQDLSMGPPPNDDLDLQIVWLAAVEKYGRNVNAAILGEYWLSYIIPNWVEYGMGKANLRAGLMPPMAGEVENIYKNSCGCFIRSEIWACLAPGHPELAARYAYEDAIVDHAGEGIQGEIFFAALESAAFVESDVRRLIDIGLSYIPEESATAKCVRIACDCYDAGVEFFEARKRVHNTAPGTFGIQSCKISEVKEEEDFVLGEPGFDAPENIGYAVLGWLYSEGDFGRALCLAVSCGEDTDCSGASLGALLGIIMGASALPEKWTEPLGDKIATLCIDKTSKGVWVPKTVTELTDRVLRTTPAFLGQEYCDILSGEGYSVACRERDELWCPGEKDYIPLINGTFKDKAMTAGMKSALSPYVVRYEHPVFYALVDYGESVHYTTGENRKFTVTVRDNGDMCQQQWVKLKLYLPEGVEAVNGKARELPLNNLWRSEARAEFEISTEFYQEAKLELIVDISLVGRHSSCPVKVVFMQK